MSGFPSLVCPECRGPVAAAPEGAVCGRCGRSYAEHDGILHLTAGAGGPPAYDPHFFGTLPAVENSHFWFVARREVILRGLRRHVPDLARRRLFDIGCGSGGLMRFLESSGIPVAAGCDAYPQALQLARRQVQAPLVLVDEGRVPPVGPGQTLIGLFDVLEHIDDDVATLAWLRSILEPGGVLCLTVPAHPFLWDEMDRRARHRRRYRRRDLQDKLEAVGFEVRWLSHFMASLVPALVLVRKGGALLRPTGALDADTEFRVVPGVNGALRALLRLEGAIGAYARFPFGSSLLAIAARPMGVDGE
jgi:SAM-dependent methyltransferase